MYLENICQPSDVKKLNVEQLTVLAQEMRDALLEKGSSYGGHMGSNLGMVETTIALHAVFDSPKDKIIYDVSHQCYCHKMLTGRKDAFLDPEKYSDVSGYTCPEESPHDFFNVGHSSTSISLACGMAKARDLTGGKENIIAVIGDGALGGGLALEALNYACELHSNLIIVVNDNQMSIAESKGGLCYHLQHLRDTDGQAPSNLFTALGLEYHLVKNGHDISALISVFSGVQGIDHPVVIHVCTQKGKGYAFAETDQENWHYRKAFDPKTGLSKLPYASESYDIFAREFLLEKMKKDPRVIVLSAGVPVSLAFNAEKRREAGQQYIDVGLAEENAITMAAGIAKNGGKPVFSTDATFFQRTYDQVSHDLCINHCPVTLMIRNASVFGMNDLSHLGIFDIPMLSNIPNFVYLAPTNKQEFLAMLDWSVEQRTYPVAIRMPRNGIFSTEQPVEQDYSSLNRYKVCSQGSRVAVLALGDFFQLGESVAQLITEKIGIVPTLINPRYITGLDEALLERLKEKHHLIITLEDGVLDGGFGEKIARFYGPSSIRVLNYGLKKEFLDRYTVSDILLQNRLTKEQITDDVIQILEESTR